MADKVKIVCPECENEFEVDSEKCEVGEILECAICGSEMEIVSIKDGKVTVELVEEEK